MAASKQPDLARELLKFMTSPDAISLLQKGHMEPARRS
jgi:ABC-type thiamine transport system substrate-binding protein